MAESQDEAACKAADPRPDRYRYRFTAAVASLVTTLKLHFTPLFLINNTRSSLSFSISSMAIVENWMPPSRENWELVVYLFQFFPIV